MFPECPAIFNPGIFPGNLPVNLRELECSRKVYGKQYFCHDKTRWPPEEDIFATVYRRRTYQERIVLDKTTEREIIERYRLSREGINWLVEEFTGQDLERDTTYAKMSAHENTGKHFQ